MHAPRGTATSNKKTTKIKVGRVGNQSRSIVDLNFGPRETDYVLAERLWNSRLGVREIISREKSTHKSMRKKVCN